MTITLEGEAAELLQRAAERAGYQDVDRFVRDRLADPAGEPGQSGRGKLSGEELVRRMTGAATAGLTTDEILAMTRGED